MKSLVSSYANPIPSYGHPIHPLFKPYSNPVQALFTTKQHSLRSLLAPGTPFNLYWTNMQALLNTYSKPIQHLFNSNDVKPKKPIEPLLKSLPSQPEPKTLWLPYSNPIRTLSKP